MSYYIRLDKEWFGRASRAGIVCILPAGKVGAAGKARPVAAFWTVDQLRARLGGMRVVAEVPSRQGALFWASKADILLFLRMSSLNNNE